ncbi:MAG: hypothetical protein LUC98_04125, partial [Lachnospiraceae bacterium]|nr:hypothetical protein [Lachnospiraceae bacterium]
ALCGLQGYFSLFNCQTPVTNVLVNSNGAIMAALIGVTVPLCEKLGYNPIFIVYTITCTGSLFFGNMYNTVMLTNKEYGWWEAKDAVVPGFVTVIFLCVAWSITTYLVAPILGISIYV